MAILSLFYGYVDKQGSSAVCVSVWRTSANARSPLAWAQGVSMRKLLSFLFFAAVPMILLAVSPGQVWAQSGTVTDDAFISTSSTTQLVNFNGQGIALVVAGSSATVGSVHVATTKTFIKFQLQSSLPSTAAAANVAKATLKLFISPSCNPSGAIDIYPVTNAWTESTLSPSSPPALALTAIATAIPVGKANSFLIVDVTQLVQGWLEGSATAGDHRAYKDLQDHREQQERRSFGGTRTSTLFSQRRRSWPTRFTRFRSDCSN
jgi:hypothetical protein